MAGPQSISDLVIWAIGAVVGFVGFYLLKTLVFPKKGGDWLPGQQYEINPQNSRQMTIRRENYVDPLKNLNKVYVAATILGVITVVFLFYFITKGSTLMGN